MRIGELSKATNVSVPTIKFYVREGLLPAGRPTASANQVEYDEAHLHRLILLRALIEVGGLSLATVRATVATLGAPIDAPVATLQALLGGAPAPDSAGAQTSPADDLLIARGWGGAGASGSISTLSAALLAFSRLGRPLSADALSAYADAADRVAKREAGAHPADADAVSAENALIDVVLGGAVLASLRELAHLQRVSVPVAAEPKSASRKPDQPKKKKSKKK
jgi:DNA-binding transcriptional MerR regulator